MTKVPSGGRRSWLKYLGAGGSGLFVVLFLIARGVRFLGPIAQFTNPEGAELLRMQEQALEAGDQLIGLSRQINDAGSAHRLAAQWVNVLGQALTLERAQQAAVLRKPKLYGSQVEQQKRNLARTQEQERTITTETNRMAAIPDVAVIIKAELERQAPSEATGVLAAFLRQLTGNNDAAHSTPATGAPPQAPEPSPGLLPRPADRTPRRRVGVNAPPPRMTTSPPAASRHSENPFALPGDTISGTPEVAESPSEKVGNDGASSTSAGSESADSAETGVSSDAKKQLSNTDPATKAKVEEFLTLVERTNAIQDFLLSVTQQIQDDRSAGRMARNWAVATRQREKLIELERNMAGLELVGADAVRYREVKSRGDQQVRDIEAETARLEELPGVMKILNAGLDKLKATDDSSEIDDLSEASKKISKPKKSGDRPLPRALKRAPAQ
ncbi:MAG TPA: hypothetical protein VGG64_05000 [Pirellulales bacterium]